MGRALALRREVLERVPEGGLASEPEAVLDPQGVDLDRMMGRFRGHHRTLAKDGSRRLKKTRASARRMNDTTRTLARLVHKGAVS